MGMELHFVELTVAHWPAEVIWYRHFLGLEPVQVDTENGFAMFLAGAGRLALKRATPIQVRLCLLSWFPTSTASFVVCRPTTSFPNRHAR